MAAGTIRVFSRSIQERAGSCTSNPALVIQGTRRKTGLVPVVACLADPDREMPLLITMKESGLMLGAVAEPANDVVGERVRSVLVISEGFPARNLGELSVRNDQASLELAANSAMLPSAVDRCESPGRYRRLCVMRVP